MAYTPEHEVLYWLTHDPEKQHWAKFLECFKNVNPFEVAQAVLLDLIRKHHSENKIPAYNVLEADVKSSDTGLSFSARIAIDELRGYKADVLLLPTALKTLREKWTERSTLKSTQIAQEIITSGYKVGRVELKGIDAAWQYLSEQRQQIVDVRDSSASAGNLLENTDALWERYQTLKGQLGPNGRVPGRMSTGINMIDEYTSGMAGGEFWLVGAYSSEGKSTLLRNMAYNLAVLQGKNVVYATAEMTRRQIENMLISRHSYSKRWRPADWTQHAPIPYRAIRDGKVADYFHRDNVDAAVNDERAATAEQFLRLSMDDLKDGYASGKYGMLDILQVPGNMTIPDMNEYLAMRNRERRIDVVFLDYALLFASHVRTNDNNEALSSKIRACKMLALDFGTREQLAVVTAHQINRQSRDEAEIKMSSRRVRGVIKTAPEDMVPYNMRAMAGTAEAEKSADVIIWMLLLEAYKKNNHVRVGLIKNREGTLGRPFNIKTDWECGYLGNMEAKGNPYSW